MAEKRKGRGTSWRVFGALWLMMACLVGCGSFLGSAENDPAARAFQTQEMGRSGSQGGEEEPGQGDSRASAEEPGQSDSRANAEGTGQGDSRANAERTGQGDSRASAESTGQGDSRASAERTGQGDSRASAKEPGQGDSRENADGTGEEAPGIEESGSYTSKDEVALYLHVYGRLPDNYMTKQEALKLGWNNKEGNLWEVAPGMSIGGSRFGNYEGKLPDKKGRRYFECDIDFEGGYRGAKRLIYSDDGLIFYTEDHYNTFEQLYGE